MNNISLSSIWNKTIESERRELKPRNYINASDLGGPYIDRYYKMMGVSPSNPYESRTLRIFAAGNEFHHLIQKVFEKIGILKSKETRVEIPETSEHLKLVGYYDMLLGGLPDWSEARDRIQDHGFSDFVKKTSLDLVDYFENLYPYGVSEQICEVKSVNSMAFWNKKNKINEGYPHHRLQLYTYLKALDIEKGTLLYISKDDLSLEECPIINPTMSLEEKFKEDIETISDYYRRKEVPPKEDDIVYNPVFKKNEVNWRILRSPYLTLMTGSSPDEWSIKTKKEVKEKNAKLKEHAKHERDIE